MQTLSYTQMFMAAYRARGCSQYATQAAIAYSVTHERIAHCILHNQLAGNSGPQAAVRAIESLNL